MGSWSWATCSTLSCDRAPVEGGTIMKRIQILGTGCPKCKALAANAGAAVKALGIEAEIEKVEKIQDIMKFGVMTTPALVIDGQVKSAGRVLSPDEIGRMLE